MITIDKVFKRNKPLTTKNGNFVGAITLKVQASKEHIIWLSDISLVQRTDKAGNMFYDLVMPSRSYNTALGKVEHINSIIMNAKTRKAIALRAGNMFDEKYNKSNVDKAVKAI